MELCRELGCPHPDYLWRVINPRQWQDWVDYYEEEPFGQQRDDLRQQVLVTLLAGMMPGGKLEPTWDSFYYPYFKRQLSHREALERIKQVQQEDAARNGGN